MIFGNKRLGCECPEDIKGCACE
ncbi:hypothetical protein THIOKS180029 [Thiocapsa sp. KS1]|nr:hypothetical protein THIOKS180029 [Thiocapsa sp. KS1]